jgi:hypothetical protein
MLLTQGSETKGPADLFGATLTTTPMTAYGDCKVYKDDTYVLPSDNIEDDDSSVHLMPTPKNRKRQPVESRRVQEFTRLFIKRNSREGNVNGHATEASATTAIPELPKPNSTKELLIPSRVPAKQARKAPANSDLARAEKGVIKPPPFGTRPADKVERKQKRRKRSNKFILVQG